VDALAEKVRARIMEVMERAHQDLFDVARSIVAEEEVLDLLLDEPPTR
jgi:hypothetical protein